MHSCIRRSCGESGKLSIIFFMLLIPDVIYVVIEINIYRRSQIPAIWRHRMHLAWDFMYSVVISCCMLLRKVKVLEWHGKVKGSDIISMQSQLHSMLLIFGWGQVGRSLNNIIEPWFWATWLTLFPSVSLCSRNHNSQSPVLYYPIRNLFIIFASFKLYYLIDKQCVDMSFTYR